MAIIKYKNSRGEYVPVSTYNLQPLTLHQTTGSSSDATMSQKAITEELAKKLNSAELPAKLNAKADKGTTLSAYGIQDAKLTSDGDITLGGQSLHLATKDYVDNKVKVTTQNVSDLSNLSPDVKIYYATISGNKSLSFSSKVKNGENVHIVIVNTSSEAVTVTLPSSGDYKANLGSMTIEGNQFGEINVLGVNNICFVRAAN